MLYTKWVHPAMSSASAAVEILLNRPLAVLVSRSFAAACSGSFVLAAYVGLTLARVFGLSEQERVALAVRLGKSVVRCLFTTNGGSLLCWTTPGSPSVELTRWAVSCPSGKT